jgi:hypothetical protein
VVWRCGLGDIMSKLEKTISDLFTEYLAHGGALPAVFVSGSPLPENTSARGMRTVVDPTCPSDQAYIMFVDDYERLKAQCDQV